MPQNSNEIKVIEQQLGKIPIAYLLPNDLEVAGGDGMTFSYIAHNVLAMYQNQGDNLEAYVPVQESLQFNYKNSSTLIARSIDTHINAVLQYLTSSTTATTQSQQELIAQLKNVSVFLQFASIFANPISQSILTYSSVVGLPQQTIPKVNGYSSNAASSRFALSVNHGLSSEILQSAFNEINEQKTNYELSLKTLNQLFSNFPKTKYYAVSIVKGEYPGKITNQSKLFLHPEYIVNIDFAVPYLLEVNGQYQMVQGFSFTLRNNLQPNQFTIKNLTPNLSSDS